MLHCGLCLPKGGPHGPANMFLMFLVRTRNLCVHQNAYCIHKTSGAERESIPFKLAHTTISNGHKQIDDASLFSGGEMNTFSSVCLL